MKKLTIMLILLFLMPFVSAEVNVLNQIENIYNINEKIPAKIAVSYNEDLDGFVKSSAICDNANVDYFITPFNLKTNPQEIIIPDLKLKENMVGKCSLEISLANSDNVLLEKKIIKIFEVSKELILNVNLNKDKFLPNEELKIDGTIKNVRGELLDKGQVKISIDNETFISELNKGEFSYEYIISGNIKSNSHSLNIEFNDDYKNGAEKEFSIFINPKATKLKNLINKLEFLPQEQVSIETLLYDQADDLIPNNANIKIYNTENELIREGSYNLDFTLDQYALPGTWIVRTSTEDFKIESKFNVLELKKVYIYIESGILYVKNIGNAIFDDSVNVKVIGEDGREFTQKIKMSPRDTKAIKLSDEIKKGGQFNVDVLVNNEKQSFENISIPKTQDPLYLTGEIISDTGNYMIDKPYIPLSIIAALLLTFLIARSNKKRDQFKREKETQLGYMKAREIEQDKIKQGIKPRRFNIDEKEAKDFTQRMLKNMNNKKEDDQGYIHRPPKNDKPGLFGMFN